jgi:hypothetical protein
MLMKEHTQHPKSSLQGTVPKRFLACFALLLPFAPFIAETRIPSHDNPFGIYVKQRCTGTSLRVTTVLSHSAASYQCCILKFHSSIINAMWSYNGQHRYKQHVFILPCVATIPAAWNRVLKSQKSRNSPPYGLRILPILNEMSLINFIYLNKTAGSVPPLSRVICYHSLSHAITLFSSQNMWHTDIPDIPSSRSYVMFCRTGRSQ